LRITGNEEIYIYIYIYIASQLIRRSTLLVYIFNSLSKEILLYHVRTSCGVELLIALHKVQYG